MYSLIYMPFFSNFSLIFNLITVKRFISRRRKIRRFMFKQLKNFLEVFQLFRFKKLKNINVIFEYSFLRFSIQVYLLHILFINFFNDFRNTSRFILKIYRFLSKFN